MVSLGDYAGREQAYVKHIFLESYLESLIFKTASTFDHIVYVDGFAGPWQSASEEFEDTSFGIALNALRKAKQAWKARRDVKMTALLVERDPKAHARLAAIPPKYPDIAITTYKEDFRTIVPKIAGDIPADAFAFYLIDPKGWKIPLEQLKPLLSRPKSEVTFTFMFEFINRAASMSDPLVIKGLDDLMPNSRWRERLKEAEQAAGRQLKSDERKKILYNAFSESLRVIGGYQYVAETPVLRPVRDRTLYSLFYATRHQKGLEVYRKCQVTALAAQSKTRAASKVKHAETSTGQAEMFGSLHDMAPDENEAYLAGERKNAEAAIRELVPKSPSTTTYRELWTAVLSLHAVRLTEVNTICANMRKRGELVFPNWEDRAHVPKDHFKLHRPQ